MNPKKRLQFFIFLMFSLYLLGSLLFMMMEGFSRLDAFYYVMVTLTGIGYGDVVPHTPAGKVLAILFAPLGIIFFGGIGMWLVEQSVNEALKGVSRRMERQVERLHDHIIVCGYGRLGSVVTELLQDAGKPFMVIEREEEKARRLAETGIPVICGNALEEEVLRRSGISRARTLMATFSDDTDNVYLVLEVRDLRPDLEVVSAASSREAVRRLTLAGANQVISPTIVGAEMLVRNAVSPVE